MAVLAPHRFTIEDFMALPEGPPYFEFEDGELIPMTTPTAEHQDITIELGYLLRTHIKRRALGRSFIDLDVFLPDGRCFVPDIVFISNANHRLLSPTDRKIHGAPDLVVEVTSSHPERDRIHKLRVYAENHVSWY